MVYGQFAASKAENRRLAPWSALSCLFLCKRLSAISAIFMEYPHYGVYNPIKIDEVIKVDVK